MGCGIPVQILYWYVLPSEQKWESKPEVDQQLSKSVEKCYNSYFHSSSITLSTQFELIDLCLLFTLVHW